MKTAVAVILGLIIPLLIAFPGFCTDYQYEVQRVKFVYEEGTEIERNLSGITITLQDDSATLSAAALGRFSGLPAGTISSLNLYLYRSAGDLWDKDGWSEWTLLNGETIELADNGFSNVTVKLQWNGISYDVVAPSIE